MSGGGLAREEFNEAVASVLSEGVESLQMIRILYFEMKDEAYKNPATLAAAQADTAGFRAQRQAFFDSTVDLLSRLSIRLDSLNPLKGRRLEPGLDSPYHDLNRLLHVMVIFYLLRNQQSYLMVNSGWLAASAVSLGVISPPSARTGVYEGVLSAALFFLKEAIAKAPVILRTLLQIKKAELPKELTYGITAEILTRYVAVLKEQLLAGAGSFEEKLSPGFYVPSPPATPSSTPIAALSTGSLPGPKSALRDDPHNPFNDPKVP